MLAFTKPQPITEVITILKLPRETHGWFEQMVCLAPDFPRRFIDETIQVVPDQAAEFLVNNGYGHLLANGPYADWDKGEDDRDPEKDNNENDEEEDEESGNEESDFDDDDDSENRHRRFSKNKLRRNYRSE